MTGSHVIEGLRAGRLMPLPGVLVLEVEHGSVVVIVTESARARSGLPAEMNAVEHLPRLLSETQTAGSQRGVNPELSTCWNRGWPEAGRDAEYVALESALHIGAGVSSREARLALARFLGRLPDPLGSSLLSVLSGRSRILAGTSMSDLSLRLQEPRPNVALAVCTSQGWKTVALDEPLGELGPVRATGIREVAGEFIAHAVVSPSIGALGHRMIATGIRPDRSDALTVAVAEAFERHTAGVIASGDLVVGSAANNPSAVHPDKFVAFAPWQYVTTPEMVPFDSTQDRVWVKVENREGSKNLVLSDFVFYPLGVTGGPRHADGNSSGMAVHRDTTLAEELAYGELVERDAFLWHWYGRMPARRLIGASLPREVSSLVENLRQQGWRCHILQMGRNPRVPAFLAVAERRGMVVIGAGAGPLVRAVTSAVREAWAGVVLPAERESVPEVEDVRTPSDHRRLYRWGDVSAHAEFLWSGAEEVRARDVGTSLEMSETSYSYQWDPFLTRPFAAVRVLDPELIPMTFGFRREPLGRADVRELLGGWGSDGASLMPHPFP